MYINLLLIAVILVIIIDLSGFTQSWKSFLKKLITRGKLSSPEYSLKPFDCSLCMTFWIGLTYLLITDQLSFVSLAYTLFVAWMTPVMGDILLFIKDGFCSIMESLRHWLSIH